MTLTDLDHNPIVELFPTDVPTTFVRSKTVGNNSISVLLLINIKRSVHTVCLEMQGEIKKTHRRQFTDMNAARQYSDELCNLVGLI